MTQTIKTDFSIDGEEYQVEFEVEAIINTAQEYFEIWGTKQSQLLEEPEFELESIVSVFKDNEEITLDKLLEKKLRKEINEWIYNNDEQLNNGLA